MRLARPPATDGHPIGGGAVAHFGSVRPRRPGSRVPSVSGDVLYEVRGDAAWLTIDRPERRNALSPGVLDGLRRASADPAVRVVVVTGAGDQAFCAGGDIGGFAEATAESAPAAIARLLDALWQDRKS